jgi:hypothetical protein
LNLDAFKRFADIGQGVVFTALEANGWSGMASLRKFSANHVWAKKGTMGRSTIPGDFRMELIVNIGGAGSIVANTDSIYQDILGEGVAIPPVIAHTLPGLFRMAFPLSPYIVRSFESGVQDNILGSQDFEVGDDIWKDRNAFAPLFFSFIAAIQMNTVDYNPELKGIHAGVRSFKTAALSLLKPSMYYQKDEGPYPHKTWKGRVRGQNSGSYIGDPAMMSTADYYTDNDENEFFYGSWGERGHYQLAPIKTIVNSLYDSDPANKETRLDGMLPVLLKNKAVTNLVKLLMSDVNDSNELYAALEQIVTSVKFTKAPGTAINETNYKKMIFPDWMFATGKDTGDFGEYTSYEGVRDEDVVFDTFLDTVIGQDSRPEKEGYGLADYVDQQKKENWAEFYDAMDSLEDVLSPSSPNSLIEMLLSFSDAVLARDYLYSAGEIKGLLYSLGKLFTYYDEEQKRWVTQGEPGFDDIYSIFSRRLPAILDLIHDDKGKNENALLTMTAEMLKTGNVVPFVLDSVSTDDGAENVLQDIHMFLGDPIVTENIPLWVTLADLLHDLAKAVDQSKDGSAMDNVLTDFGFQIN